MNKDVDHFKSSSNIRSEFLDILEDDNSLIPDNSKIIMGCSCNYQMIDLFNIYNEINKSTNINIDECCKLFDEAMDNYFNNHEDIYNGINSMTYLEVERVYLNLKNRYSFITIKEEFKMDNIIRDDIRIFDSNGNLNEDIYNFKNIDSIYKFAQNNNLDIKISFGFSDNDISKNLKREILDIFYDDTNKARYMLVNFLENYFKILGDRYQCLEWSILSDIIYKNDGLGLDNTILKESFFRNILGDDYFIDILKIARKNLSSTTKIGYTEGNEYDLITRTHIIEVINKIKAFELNNNMTLLDFVGISGYYNDNMSCDDIETIYKDFASLGKDINILELNVLNLQNNQKNVFKNIFDLAYIYNIYSINMLGANDKLVDDKYKGSTMVDENCIEKDFFNDFSYLFVNNANYIKDSSISDVISIMGKSIGTYMSYELLKLFNKLNNELISYDEKMLALDDYKKHITNNNNFSLGDCDLTELDYNDILTLASDISNNITLLSINNFFKSFDESIDCNNFTINNSFNIDDATSEYLSNNKISVEISNLFCNDFKYPKNLDNYLENIYNKEDRLLTQKERNNVLIDLASNYLKTITNNLNSKNIKLESVIVLNNILNEHGSTKWWSENFGDDYYVTLFQIANKLLTDNVQLGWFEDKLLKNKNKRDDFLSCVERIIKHDPFLISYIGSDIIIDNDFDIDQYDDFISEINNFCKRMMDNYGADIKFKISNLSFKCINNTNKLAVVKHILNSISTKYFVGVNIGNLLVFNSFSFIDGLGNKVLQKYDSYTRKIFDILNYNMDYNMSGNILENNIIYILQQYHDKQMKAIISCNNSFPETFVNNSNDSHKSQDFLQVESSAKHIAEVTRNITSTFPKTISVIQEATSMGCTSPIEYLNVVPLLYNTRVVKNDMSSIRNPLNNKDKFLFKKSNINNIGFSSYLTLTFIIVFFIIIFVLCILYYI